MSAPAGTQVRTALSITDNGKWNLVPYTGPALQGAFLTDPSPEVVVGTAFSLDAVVYSSSIGVNGPATFSAVGLDNNPATTVMLNSNTGSGSAAQPGTVFIVLNFTGSSVGYKYPMGIKTSTCHTVVLDMKYDHAYSLRYLDAPDRIRSHFYALRELYINEFDIWIKMTGPTLFSCYACEKCQTLSSPEGACECVGNNLCQDSYRDKDTNVVNWREWHHTNIANILYHITDEPNTNQSFLMCFVGHECCFETDHSLPYCGLTDAVLGRMIISVSESDPGAVITERQTMVHEFGHMYGIEDHYGDGCPSTQLMNELNGTDAYYWLCIYGEGHDGFTTSYPICDGCRETIENNSGRYSHE